MTLLKFDSIRWKQIKELTEQLDFANIPFTEGEYSLEYHKHGDSNHSNPTVTFTIIDYDVLRHQYQLDSTKSSSFITIDEISEDRKVITGSFQATFVLDETYSGAPSKEWPKVIEFTSGIYAAKEGS